MNCKKEDLLLYAVTDRTWLNGNTLYHQIEQAIEGGATFIQLREKNLDKERFLQEAKEIKELCKKHQIPLIINDNVEIALAVDADGVHVGQQDMEVQQAREKLGADKIIGVSVQTVEQALLAQKNGADYLGVGAIFTTQSKSDALNITHKTLCDICEKTNIPVVAIGGITKENVIELSDTGICGIAVISAIFAQNNIVEATKVLKNITKNVIMQQ